MAYLPGGFDVPPYLPHEAGFAEGCRAHRLCIQRCLACGRFRHPPQPRCAYCRSDRSEWTEVSGDGHVYTWTVVRHAANPALREALPYNVVVVLLDGTDGVRLVSNLVDVPPGQLRIGMRVKLTWERRGDVDLPCFRAATPLETSDE